MKKNLTPQQENFIKCYVNGQTASESVKNSYNVKSMSNIQIAQKANSLLNNDFVKKEIEKRKEKTSVLLNYTQEESFNKIKALQELAEQKNDITNALKAEEMKQKLAGINKDNTSLNFGIVGDFKEFYAAICAKKDYGSTKTIKEQSKSDVLDICPESQIIGNKQNKFLGYQKFPNGYKKGSVEKLTK